MKWKKLSLKGGEIIPIMSTISHSTNNKFGNVNEFANKIESITNKKIISNMEEVEDLDADIMIIAPCSRK